MPGASLMMRFFGSPPRESRSASGPGTEADYQQGGGEDPGALRAARTSGKGRETARPRSCTRRRRPTSRRSAEAADRNLTTRATQPTETGLAGWAYAIEPPNPGCGSTPFGLPLGKLWPTHAPQDQSIQANTGKVAFWLDD